jgi:hypothetical protein
LTREVFDAADEQVKFSKLSKESCFVSGILNFNAKTGVPHTEQDPVYILIGVPHQEKEVLLQFLFHEIGGEVFKLCMFRGVQLFFSAPLLTHNQDCINIIPDGNFNVSAYSPKLLVHNFSKSVCSCHRRNTNVKKVK